MLSPLVICLALNIYWEARSEDAKHGIYALAAPALVVLNRVKHKDYPNHVCDVVKQSETYHNGFPKKTNASLAGTVTVNLTSLKIWWRGDGHRE